MEARRIESTVSPIRLARIWMNLGVRMQTFRTVPKADRWDEHRRLVVGQFLQDRQQYRARVNRLIRTAEAAPVEGMLFPACVLVHGGGGLKRAGYCFPENGFLVGGALDIAQRPAREYGLVIQTGSTIGTFTRHEIGRFSQLDSMILVAISSTIRRLWRFPAEESKNFGRSGDPQSSRILLLDVGHHPYSDHYRRHTLRKAVETLHRRHILPAAAVLSSWQYLTSTPTPSWCMPPQAARIVERMNIDGDLLDVVEINFRNEAIGQ